MKARKLFPPRSEIRGIRYVVGCRSRYRYIGPRGCDAATLQPRGGSFGSRYRAKLGLVQRREGGLVLWSPDDVIELAPGHRESHVL